MKKFLVLCVVLIVVIGFSFSPWRYFTHDGYTIDSLRKVYSGSSALWPKTEVDSGVHFKELTALPKPPFSEQTDSVKDVVVLGKLLFFDPRLSGSNQISCASCHAPSMSWTDGRVVPVGNDHLTGPRNVPSNQNTWDQKAFFYDGRASTYEEQAVEAIRSHHEMNQDFKKLPAKLSKIKGYQPFFTKVFGDKKVTGDRITHALAMYQRTLVSRKSDFDYFVEGDSKRLTDQQVLGLHLFRTKGKCVNCHHGPMFTDNEFHNLGLTYYKRDKYEDWGRYHVTKDPNDVGKFKTPGLRDVMNTKPWFHTGLFGNIDGVLNMYNAGAFDIKPKTTEEMNDPFFPKKSHLLHKLNLTKEERDAIVSFLHSITAEPWRVHQPTLPQ